MLGYIGEVHVVVGPMTTAQHMQAMTYMVNRSDLKLTNDTPIMRLIEPGQSANLTAAQKQALTDGGKVPVRDITYAEMDSLLNPYGKNIGTRHGVRLSDLPDQFNGTSRMSIYARSCYRNNPGDTNELYSVTGRSGSATLDI